MPTNSQELLFEECIEYKKSRLDSLLLFLFPDLEVAGSKYESLWAQTQRQGHRKRAIVVLLIGIVACVIHLPIDKALDLKPFSTFLQMRLSSAFTALIALIYQVKFYDLIKKRYKLVDLVVMIVMCQTQMQLTIVEPKVPFFFRVFVPYHRCVYI